MKKIKKHLVKLLWLVEGVVVGFGAILPGISGGTLCVAFGMYRPAIEVFSDFRHALKKYWLMLGIFFVGVLAGFVGLSGITKWLMDKNTTLVVCAFIGFILGTVPELWEDAGEQGRGKKSYITGILCFVIMVGVLFLLKSQLNVQITPGIAAYLLCGIFWGLSFIVPGLSSSSLLLFFGLYYPMTDGIARFDFSVLIPMGIGALACVLLLSKAVGYAYKKFYSLVSHGIIGIVLATVVMIFPPLPKDALDIVWYILCIIGGGLVSFGFTRMCKKIKAGTERANAEPSQQVAQFEQPLQSEQATQSEQTSQSEQASQSEQTPQSEQSSQSE